MQLQTPKSQFNIHYNIYIYYYQEDLGSVANAQRSQHKLVRPCAMPSRVWRNGLVRRCFDLGTQDCLQRLRRRESFLSGQFCVRRWTLQKIVKLLLKETWLCCWLVWKLIKRRSIEGEAIGIPGVVWLLSYLSHATRTVILIDFIVIVCWVAHNDNSIGDGCMVWELG